MPKNRYVCDQLRRLILKEYKDNMGISDIARKYEFSHATISKIVHGLSHERKEGGGRKCTLSDEAKNNIRINLKKHHDEPISMIIRNELPSVSRGVLDRYMRDCGLRQAHAVVRPFLKPVHKAARLAFAKEYLNRPDCFWRSIYYADETMISSNMNPRHPMVICGRYFPKQCTRRIPRFKSTSSTMFWVAIKFGEHPLHSICPPRMNAETFSSLMKDIFHLKEKKSRRSGPIILQDNAPCHVAKKVCFY